MKHLLSRFMREWGPGIFANAGWLYLDQVVRLAVGLIVFSLVVRSLGAEQYGVLSYAMAFPGIFLPLAVLGLDYVVVRDFVRYPAEKELIFDTVFVLKIGAALVAFSCAMIAAWVAPLGVTDRSLLMVTSLSLLVQPLVTVDYYFQSQIASKYSSIARMATALTANGTRAWLALHGAPVVWFVWLFAVEVVLYAISLLILKRTAKIAWLDVWGNFDRSIARRLLIAAWPLFLADIAMIGFLKLDQILLTSFSGLRELGKYAAAFRLTDSAEFFALALINSYFPRIIQLHQESPGDLLINVQRFFLRMNLFVMVVAALVSVGAPVLAKLVFGSTFGAIWPVLVILIWANVFVTQIAVRGKWFLMEGLQIYSLVFFAIGAAFHLTALSYLAPRWGAMGAAVCFCLTQALMALVLPVLFNRTRSATVLALRSFLPWGN